MPSVEELETSLSDPNPGLVQALRELEGDILVLGASGKMGPTLARLAQRASDEAGVPRIVWAVARFTDQSVARRMAGWGLALRQADLLDPAAVAALPDCPNIVLMAGHKFGTGADPERTNAINVTLPGLVAERFPDSRLVTFSTGNVYPLTPVTGGGSVEDDRLDPVGEYARSTAERERVLTDCSVRHDTPMAMLRLNYAIEPRYGVLRDIADRVYRGEPIDLATGHVNVIWQQDANDIALRLLNHCQVPPFVLNVTGPETLAVRSLALAFGERFGVEPHFTGTPADTALLSNASRSVALFGPPPTSVDTMIDTVALWVKEGGASLGKPTGFQEREGDF